MKGELGSRTISELTGLFERREASPADYLEELIERTAALQPLLNAYIRFEPEEARVAFARHEPHGALTGIPIAVKDNIVTASMPTTCGSRILGSDFRSPFDATALARLRRAGSYAVGKTNLDEFAMGSSTEHSSFGVCRNPWDASRVAGGSSGGSAAAVAARLVPAALGSDTGGSVRQPAAFCGVLGLKPTWGRVSRSGLVAFASSLDQIGILARTAIDAAMVLSEMAGRDEADSTSSSEPVPDYPRLLDSGVEGMKLGVLSEAVDELTGEVRTNFEDAVAVLEKGGAVVTRVSVPAVRYAIAVYYIVANAEASANLSRFDGVRYGRRADAADTLEEVYSRSRGEGFGPEVKRRIMLGTFALSSGYYEAYYGRAQKVRALMRSEFDAALRSVDYILTPTTPTPAFRIGEKTSDPLSMYLSDIYTAPANLLGVPAIAIPSGFTAKALPLSLQVMGRHFDEAGLLRIAHHFERETGYWRREPGAAAPAR